MKKTLIALALTLIVSWVTIKFVLFAAWQAQTFFSGLSTTGQWVLVGVELLIGFATLGYVGSRAWRQMRKK